MKGSFFEVFLLAIFFFFNAPKSRCHDGQNIWAKIHKKEILVALGCKSLYEAAAAHVNNNAKALRRRIAQSVREEEERQAKGKKMIGMRGDRHLEGFDRNIGWLLELKLHRLSRSSSSEITPVFQAVCQHCLKTAVARSATVPSASPATLDSAEPFVPLCLRLSYSAPSLASEAPRAEGNFASPPVGD